MFLNRLEFVLTAVAIATAIIGLVALIVRQKNFYLQTELAALKSERDSWCSIAGTAVENIEASVNRLRAAEGKSDFEVIPDVVPEHSSPITERQQGTVDVATMRARLTAAVAALGLDPRT